MAGADTSVEAARIQRAVLASKTGSERVAMAVEMSQMMRRITIDGIRRRNPGIGDSELLFQLIERLHGRELAEKVAASCAAAAKPTT